MRQAAIGACLACTACQDLSGFTTGGDSYEGPVVQAAFVRSGIAETSRACVTLDADHFQDAPGVLSTSDGVFHAVAMRPIPQIWHDALSTFTLAPVADRIHQDVLVFAGTEDQFIPVGQVGQYTKALTHARSVTAKVYDRASGGAEHSQMGASTLWQADFFDWVEERFER